ncbi:MAG TPA: type I methionyl aminopeptidase, partial [Bacteroidales bacterium]|nr:type I methionyl aminopeptidase [Bacteroidales bacterium]
MKIFNRKIYLKNKSEIELIKESALIVGLTLAEVAKYIKPGVPSNYLDKIAEDFIRSHQAVPSFKGYNGFPASLCISINDVVVHGIPSRQVLQEGDIVSVDCGVYKNGYHGDYAYTFAVGEISEEKNLLVERTKKSLYKGINEAKKGNHIGDISHAIQSYVESFGYGVVRELVGHGIGKKMHEKPDIPNYGKKGKGELIVPGMVFCIEPMINLGTPRVSMDADNWTIRT